MNVLSVMEIILKMIDKLNFRARELDKNSIVKTPSLM